MEEVTDTQVNAIENKDIKYNDLLGRRDIARNFLEVIKTQNANVYSINASWGAGKTWFLKFIEDECKNQNIPFIQFNVWESDYSNDPFQAIINELLNLLKLQIQTINAETESQKFEQEIELIKEKATQFITSVRKRMTFNVGLNIPAVPVAIGATINPDHSPLAGYEDMKELKNDFIQALKSFIKDFNLQLIIAIDELDRCRPDFAISTLEIIKHFFTIDGIKFILAVDKDQLNRTIYALYGNMPDTDAYLSKFVDMQYTLSPVETDDYISNLFNNKYPIIRQTLEYLCQNSKVLIKYNDGETAVWIVSHYEENADISTFKELCQFCNLSLRDIDKLCLKLSIILPILSKKSYILQLDFLVQLLLLNIKDRNLYSQIKELKPIDLVNCNYKVNQIFNEVYKSLVDIKTNPQHFYQESPKIRQLYQANKSLLAYFNMIDFAEDFS